MNDIMDVMILKIKNAETSLYMFRTIDIILKKKKQIMKSEEIRNTFKCILEDVDTFLFWKTLITRKYPCLAEWCLDIQSVYVKSLSSNGLCKNYISTFQNENDVYLKMYKHFLNIFFINVKMFLTDSYELIHTMNKINNSWLEFLIVNIDIKPIDLNYVVDNRVDTVEHNSIQVKIFE